MAWTLIDHVASPTSDQLNFTSLTLTSYRRVVLMLDDVRAGTDGAFLLLQLSTAATLRTAGYRWKNRSLSTSGSDDNTNSTSDSSIRLIGGSTSAWGIGNASTKSGMCRVELAGIDSGLAVYKTVLFDGMAIGPSGNSVRQIGCGILEQTGTLDGIRVLMSTGTMAAGTATLYGLTIS